jgi:hypothetical protein
MDKAQKETILHRKIYAPYPEIQVKCIAQSFSNFYNLLPLEVFHEIQTPLHPNIFT